LKGTKTPGLATRARTLLTTEGFVVNSTGNAQFTDFTETEISARSDVNVAFVEKLREVLAKEYIVNSDLGVLEDSENADIVITLGVPTPTGQ
jgi:hypothetical protein